MERKYWKVREIFQSKNLGTMKIVSSQLDDLFPVILPVKICKGPNINF